MHERFSLRGDRGTVLWEGSLEGQAWLGIAWDDPRRGKHDGTYKDTRLFSCRQGAGSFLKVSKFKPDATCTLTQALRRKYQEAGTLHAGTTVKGVSRVAEQVGFHHAQERYSDVQALKLVSLESCCIDTLDQISLPQCEDLDLSCNLIDDLDEVARLISSLPSLKCLRLAGNRFIQLETRHEAAVESLHLGDTLLPWQAITELCTRWQIKHLFLEHNELDNPPADVVAASVLSVELSGNRVTDVHSITHCLPCLQSLDLSSNAVAAIQTARTSHPLKKLALQQNPLSVDELRNMPYDLAELSMSQLADPEADIARRLDILRAMPELQILNRTRITAQERQDALAVTAPLRNRVLLLHDLLNLTLAWDTHRLQVRVLKSQTILQMRNLVKRVAGVRPSCEHSDYAVLDSLGISSGDTLLFHIHRSD